MKILFVCTGNTCRSPMAEGFMNKIAKEKNLDVTAESAGIFAQEGESASEEAVEASKKYGVDISKHKARTLTNEILNDADLILTMTESHRELLFPLVSDKIFTLNGYAKLDGDIPDPFGGDLDEYIETADNIIKAIEIIAEGLKK